MMNWKRRNKSGFACQWNKGNNTKISVLYPAFGVLSPLIYINTQFLVTEAGDVIDSITESFGIRTVTYSS